MEFKDRRRQDADVELIGTYSQRVSKFHVSFFAISLVIIVILSISSYRHFPMLDFISEFGRFGLALLAIILVLWFFHWFLIGRLPELGNERKFSRQLSMLGLTIMGVLVCILALPVSESSRNQLIGLLGILISGVLAFSSTTIISNLMAGVLLRITKPFHVGDFIRVGTYFGRVSERGLFDTEIQTETRELIALPNTFCITTPVSTIRKSGTIVSVSLSLGYDVHHQQVEELLKEAALGSGLSDPYVHITELGNHSVTYRISGFLEEIKRLLSVKSNLYSNVLDTLHRDGVEIMSPAYMNQRPMTDGTKVVPASSRVIAPQTVATEAEDLVFDKAEQAEALEEQKKQLAQDILGLEERQKNSDGEQLKKRIGEQIESKRKALKELEQQVVEANSRVGNNVSTNKDVVE